MAVGQCSDKFEEDATRDAATRVPDRHLYRAATKVDAFGVEEEVELH